MLQRLIVLAVLAAVPPLAVSSADGKITQHGRAIVEYRSDEGTAVASYEYSQRNHDGAWLLIEFAIQARQRIAVHRDQFTLVDSGEQVIPVATQPQFLEERPALTKLLQNASVWRRPLEPYFTSRPVMQTIRFFAAPGGLVIDSAVTNPDEVATGDLLFKSPDGKWKAGTYRLVLHHEKFKAELPIELQ